MKFLIQSPRVNRVVGLISCLVSIFLSAQRVSATDTNVSVLGTVVFLQVFDNNHNYIPGTIPEIRMRGVLIRIRGIGFSKFVRTNSRGRFAISLPPGTYSIGLGKNYYANQFCGVKPPACNGQRIELVGSRDITESIAIGATTKSFRLRYNEEFGV